MDLHGIALGAFAVVVLPSIAEAAWGEAMEDLNVRACAGTQCPAIGIVPAGAPVWVAVSLGGWYQVTFRGMTGYASARYIGIGYAAPPHYVPSPVYVPLYAPRPPVIVVSPYPNYVALAQPIYGYAWPGHQHHGPWYEGRLRYFGHPWHQ